jgi:hypothetical protein
VTVGLVYVESERGNVQVKERAWKSDCGMRDCGRSECAMSDCGMSDCGRSECAMSDCGMSDCGRSECGMSDFGLSDCGRVCVAFASSIWHYCRTIKPSPLKAGDLCVPPPLVQ